MSANTGNIGKWLRLGLAIGLVVFLMGCSPPLSQWIREDAGSTGAYI